MPICDVVVVDDPRLNDVTQFLSTRFSDFRVTKSTYVLWLLAAISRHSTTDAGVWCVVWTLKSR